MINCRDIAVDAVDTAIFDAYGLCYAICKDEEYTYSFSDIVQVARLILEVEHRIKVANET